MGTASRTPLPRSPDFNEANFSDKPAIIRYAAPRKMNRKEIRARAAAYRRQIEAMRSVDQGIGEVMRALRRTGELANTYVFILSDHGTFLGEHRFSHGKFLAYEEAASVSMAVRGPGVPRGARSAEVVGNIDVPATIFDLAGAAPRYPVDGRSLEPFWKDPRRETHRGLGISLLAPVRGGDAPRAGTSDRSPSWRYRAFRVGPYKYINYWWAGEHEMYDLRRDPFELENVYGNPAYADVRAYMERHLDRFSKCQGAACQVELPPWPEPST
jgi:arylsulfatase A-like enzyme